MSQPIVTDADAATEGGVIAPVIVEEQAGGVEVPGGSILRQVLFLAGPVLIEQSLLYLVGLSDTWLTGRYLDEDRLAAVTVASYLLWFLGSMLTVVSVGATALVARLRGAGDRDGANRICQQAIFLAFALGTTILVAGIGLAPTIVGLLNLQGVAGESAALFLRIVLLVTPLLAVTAGGIACLRGSGDTRTGMWVMILVNVINIAFSWGLLHGFGPLPEMGFAGIATGTALGEGVGGVLVLLLLFRGRSGLKIDLHGLAPRATDLRRMLRISLPAAGENLSNSVCQLWFLGLINKLGTVASAAHGVAIRCESIAFLTVMAFSVSASTLTGQYLGAGRPDLAEKAVKRSWALGVFVLTTLGALIYWQADGMFWLFIGDRQPEVNAAGVPVLRIVAFALPALATINVLNGALRGAGETRWPWVFVVIGYLTVRMPLTYWLTTSPESGGLGWGLRGAWIAMLCDLLVRGSLVATRFLQGGWKHTKV